MAVARRTPSQQRDLNELLTRDHTLNGAILFGLDGHVVEMQARAMDVLPAHWRCRGAFDKMPGQHDAAQRQARARQ